MKSLLTFFLISLLTLPSLFAQLNYGEASFGIYGFSFSLGFGGGEVDLGGYFVVRGPNAPLLQPVDAQLGGVVAFDKKFAFNGARATAGLTGMAATEAGLGSGFSLHLHYVQERGKQAYVPLTLGVHPGLVATNTFSGRITYSVMLWNAYEYDDADKGLWRKDNFDIRPGFDLGASVALSLGEGLITPVTTFDANLLHLNTARRTTGELQPRKISSALHLRAGYVTSF